jgi:hypothetical protein
MRLWYNIKQEYDAKFKKALSETNLVTRLPPQITSSAYKTSKSPQM